MKKSFGYINISKMLPVNLHTDIIALDEPDYIRMKTIL